MYAYLALAGLQVASGFQQGQIIRQNGDLQAEIQEANAKYAQVDAYNALETGYGNAAKYQDVVDATVAADRGAYASEGVQIGYGTAGQQENDNHIAGMVNTLQIQKQARDQSVGYQVQGLNFTMAGQMTQLQSTINAGAAQSAGILQGIQSGAMAAYYGNSAGQGKDSTTGSDSKPGQVKPVTMNLTPGGDGVTSSPGWYADPGVNGQPGFYGQGPRSEYGAGTSFSSETA